MNKFKQFAVSARLMNIVLFVALVLASCGKHIEESGKVDDITWKLTANGTLIISGRGEMPYERPWLDFQSSITAIE